MANMPHPDRKAVTWRLHKNLVACVQAAATANGETVLAFVTRALERELERAAQPADQEPCLCTTGFTCLAREHDDAHPR